MGPLQAYAPASVGNFAAGFDLLGAALAPVDGTLLGDVVTVRPAETTTLTVGGPRGAALRTDRPNLVLRAFELYRGALEAMGLPCGPFALHLDKRLPLESGLGSSASSLVATLVALQAACGAPLDAGALLDLAGQGEGTFSGGRHLDNVAPCLLGGLRLVVPGGTRALAWPGDLRIVVAHPDMALATAVSRSVLPAALDLSSAVGFAQNLAAFALALERDDRDLLARTLRDPLAEPHRAPLVPGFRQAQAAALAAGALGCSLSGSGPSVFAVAPAGAAATVEAALRGGLEGAGLAVESWICRLDAQGARLLDPPE